MSLRGGLILAFSKAKSLLRRCFAVAYRFTAYLLIWCLPARLWYPIVLFLARVQGQILCWLAPLGLYPYRRDVYSWQARKKILTSRVLDIWLRQLSASRRPFPIPIRAVNGDAVRELTRGGIGMVLCSVHSLLADTALRAIAELDLGELAIITSLPDWTEGQPVIGTERTIATIYTDENVLLKTRRVLRGGGSIIILLDRIIGGPLEAHILHLARALGARAGFGIAELQPNGEILLECVLSPASARDDADSVQRFLEALDAHRSQVLHLAPNKTDLSIDLRKHPVSPTANVMSSPPSSAN